MSKHILKEFYRGNLSPADKQMVKGSGMARAMDEFSKAEELLAQTIPPEFKPALKRLTEAQITLNDLTAEAYYVDGFKTGTCFMLAVHDGKPAASEHIGHLQRTGRRCLVRPGIPASDRVGLGA